jgi:hypothetical protein
MVLRSRKLPARRLRLPLVKSRIDPVKRPLGRRKRPRKIMVWAFIKTLLMKVIRRSITMRQIVYE